MSKKLDKAFYMRNQGTKCPYCGSENIDSLQTEHDDFTESILYESVKCLDCSKEWTDEYKLIDVHPEEKGEEYIWKD